MGEAAALSVRAQRCQSHYFSTTPHIHVYFDTRCTKVSPLYSTDMVRSGTNFVPECSKSCCNQELLSSMWSLLRRQLWLLWNEHRMWETVIWKCQMTFLMRFINGLWSVSIDCVWASYTFQGKQRFSSLFEMLTCVVRVC